jgi:hypothetical protein
MTRKRKRQSSLPWSKDDDLLYALDPVTWAKEVLGFKPDPWQQDLLRSRQSKIILNCSRQSGKSTTTAALGLHECIYRRPTVGLCVAPGIRQSGELMQKFDEFRGAVELPSDYLDEDTKLSVKFNNKNRFLALPGSEKTVRGISAVTLLLEDEASRVLDELYKSVRPMLAVSHGRHILMSTPFGKRGHFWEVWEKRRKGVAPKGKWQWFLVSADDCPRIQKDFLEEEREELGELFFQQEYYNQFIDEETQLFTHDAIMKALSSDVAMIEI